MSAASFCEHLSGKLEMSAVNYSVLVRMGGVVDDCEC